MNDSPWIAGSRESLGLPALVCFPHAGGGSAAFWGWRAHACSDFDLLIAQLPGRERRFREKPLTHLRETIDHLSAALVTALRGPYVMFGHSLGALTAFEVARTLVGRGLPHPELLVLSACAAPHLGRTEEWCQLDDEQLINRCMMLNGLPEEPRHLREFMAVTLPALRADLRAGAKHVVAPGKQLACPILCLMGGRDPLVQPRDMAGWAEYTSGDFAITCFEGDHFYLQERTQEVVQLIRDQLSTARSPTQGA